MQASWKTDLLSRFLINLPTTEQSGFRLMYHLEQAYWFYLDFYARNEKETKAGFAAFAAALLPPGNCKQDLAFWEDCYTSYVRDYKHAISTAGVVITRDGKDNHPTSNKEVLLVRPLCSQKWGFPKGKMNRGETPWDAARRECWEETGLTLPAVPPHCHQLAVPHSRSLFLFHCHEPVPQLDTLVKLQAHAREEIQTVQWFSIQNGCPNGASLATKQQWSYLKAFK